MCTANKTRHIGDIINSAVVSFVERSPFLRVHVFNSIYIKYITSSSYVHLLFLVIDILPGSSLLNAALLSESESLRCSNEQREEVSALED